MEDNHYELLLTIQKDIEKIRNDLVELKNAEEVKLNSIQEAVSKRVHDEIENDAYDLKMKIDFAIDRLYKLDSSMFKITCYLDEIGKKVLDFEKLIK
ncbi:hypothetical protein AEA09_14775 [Lysinibacillus contaminans]|uniref:Uncharacterized protein n=1 Tax=Lysinibacillus contaminans TaxID=1293441 RepID=A0ABR5JZ99_9BACI|nr:hypothetical protein [Lysinibacillus contaminans]KOS67114.1 hypothetical protein AEA09_14775 [Lysinibacillus contaminans]